MSTISAPDLTQRAPRSPRISLGGYVILPRILDKARATIASKNGEFHYDCPLDKHFFNFVQLDAAALLEELKSGKGDGETLAWIQENRKIQRSDWEIQAWSTFHTNRGPTSDAETAEFFTGKIKSFNPNREDVTTWFALLDVDDFVSFGGKA